MPQWKGPGPLRMTSGPGQQEKLLVLREDDTQGYHDQGDDAHQGQEVRNHASPPG